jgi:hypothetical protein
VRYFLSASQAIQRDPRQITTNDPVARARATLLSDPDRLIELELLIEIEIADILTTALQEVDV